MSKTEVYPQPQIHLVDSKSLAKAVIVSLCLVATTLFANRLVTFYLDRVGEIKTWNLVVHYSDTAAGLLLVLEMIIAAAVFGIPQQRMQFEALKRLLVPTSLKSVLWGAASGVAVGVAILPLMLIFDQHVQFPRLLLDDPMSSQTLLLICLLGLLIPIATEIVFRGIVLDVLMRRTNAAVAIVVSSLLFALVWVPLDAGAGFLLGLACALLYRRFNSLVPSISCSSVATLFATTILFCRLLFRG